MYVTNIEDFFKTQVRLRPTVDLTLLLLLSVSVKRQQEKESGRERDRRKIDKVTGKDTQRGRGDSAINAPKHQKNK